VSGLILLFERPVEVGNTIEVSDRIGSLTRIGLRSSVVRTSDGSNLIIPNGELLSKLVTNWTQADRQRPLKIPVKPGERARALDAGRPTQPVLAQSIRLRNPYVDPLNYLQIRFLARWRKANEKQRTETLRRLLALTVNGIAFGMKSTG